MKCRLESGYVVYISFDDFNPLSDKGSAICTSRIPCYSSNFPFWIIEKCFSDRTSLLILSALVQIFLVIDEHLTCTPVIPIITINLVISTTECYMFNVLRSISTGIKQSFKTGIQVRFYSISNCLWLVRRYNKLPVIQRDQASIAFYMYFQHTFEIRTPSCSLCAPKVYDI